MCEELSFERGRNWRVQGIALARFTIFVTSFVALNIALNALLLGIQSHLSTLEEHLVLAMGSLCVAVIALTAIMAKTENRQLADFGFARTRCAQNFALGIACGFVGLSLQLAVLGLTGVISRVTFVSFDTPLFAEGFSLAVLFFLTAVTEEALFRGYVLIKLSQVVSFWPAAIFLAALFGAFHGIKGGGENKLGGASAFAIALAFAYSFRLTGTLWLSIGGHFGWNFAQSFIFGLPNSALNFSGSLLRISLHGTDLLTGGTVGPEGSILALIFPCLVMLVSWYRRLLPDA